MKRKSAEAYRKLVLTLELNPYDDPESDYIADELKKRINECLYQPGVKEVETTLTVMGWDGYSETVTFKTKRE